MDSKANYALVGVFVTVLSIVLIIIAFWLSYGFENKRYNIYYVYMKESVNGLSLNSPVKFNGVNIGFVRDIRLRHDNPQEVELHLDIEDDIPITETTTATLATQGLTGISYVNLKGGRSNSPILVAAPGEPYPVIKSEPSLLVRLDATLQELSVSLTKLSKDVSHFFESHDAQFTTIFEKTSEASQQFPLLVNNLNKTTTQLNVLSNQALPQMIETMRQAGNATAGLEELTSELRENPSMLIRGRAAQPPGPGE